MSPKRKVQPEDEYAENDDVGESQDTTQASTADLTDDSQALPIIHSPVHEDNEHGQTPIERSESVPPPPPPSSERSMRNQTAASFERVTKPADDKEKKPGGRKRKSEPTLDFTRDPALTARLEELDTRIKAAVQNNKESLAMFSDYRNLLSGADRSRDATMSTLKATESALRSSIARATKSAQSAQDAINRFKSETRDIQHSLAGRIDTLESRIELLERATFEGDGDSDDSDTVPASASGKRRAATQGGRESTPPFVPGRQPQPVQQRPSGAYRAAQNMPTSTSSATSADVAYGPLPPVFMNNPGAFARNALLCANIPYGAHVSDVFPHPARQNYVIIRFRSRYGASTFLDEVIRNGRGVPDVGPARPCLADDLLDPGVGPSRLR